MERIDDARRLRGPDGFFHAVRLDCDRSDHRRFSDVGWNEQSGSSIGEGTE